MQIQNIELNSGIAKLNLYLKKAESADRGYIISGNPEFLETFDADIDSIYAIYLSIQQLQNRKDHEQDGLLFMKSDKLIKQKIAFMQRIKLLCDQHNNKAAAALLATNEGLHLADSILKINKQISDNIQGRLKKSQSGFLTLNKTNRSLAFSAMASSLVLIVLIFYLLMQEVRETKKIAGELLIRKQFYQTTLSSLNEGLITTDKEGNIEYINSAAERLTGWRWQEAKNQPLHTVFDVVNEKTGKPFENIVNRVLQYGTAIGLENNTLLKTKDARTYIISNNGAPLFDVNGQIAGAVLVFNDITEKYRIEKQLKDSEEKYRSLFEQASDAILIYSFDGTIHEFNKACYSMLGYSKEEYAKLKLTDILVEEIIVDRDNYAAILDGETRTVYRSLRRKDGSLLETEVTVKMLADGKAIAFARDVTERKKAEQSLRESEIFSRSILTSINYHIAVVEANGNIISVNKAWNDFSIANGETVLERTGVGSNYIDVCRVSAGTGDTSAAKALKGFQQVIKKEIPFFEMEYPCHSMDEQRWFLLRIVNFAEDSPKVVMMHIDITELKNAGEVVSRNEKRFRAMIENNNGIIALVDENFKTIYRSPSAVRITGWTVGELASMGIENLIHPDDRNLLKTTWADLIANPGKLQTLSIRTLHKNGNYIYLEGTAINLLDDKSVKAIVTNMLDVTERKTAEILMKKAIERYDILSEATSDTIWDWDIKSNWMRYNEGISKMFGYSAGEVVNVDEWRNEKLHVDDYQSVVESLEEAFEKKTERLQLQYRFRCADGTYKHIFDRAFVLFDDDGNPARMIGAMQDITYRVEEEKRISKAIIDA
ncbi:MAG: PAS domain S-box protein, partial [Chitinophagaceae bacterium]|nr:PAS domain S-box protein [Chitinophagaceae bacterium]